MEFKEFIIFLGTKDLKRTSKFYQDIMGLSLYKDQGICLIFNISNQSKIGFCEHMAVIYKDKSPIITFVREDIDDFYIKLINLGVSIKEKPKINETFKIYHFFIEDPNGYTIEIQKFLDT